MILKEMIEAQEALEKQLEALWKIIETIDPTMSNCLIDENEDVRAEAMLRVHEDTCTDKYHCSCKRRK